MERQYLPPLALENVAAGFPSPAETYVEEPLDLHRLLIYRPAATFFVRVSGDSMLGAGIQSGDILIVDRSLTARDGSVVIASLDGDFTVKELRRGRDGSAWLVPANPQFQAINVTERSDFSIFGIVTACIHQFVHEHARKS
ncbi:MAG: translesion error-prone DNA polymerase V autoproteolytic subunit [Lentisphaeria bacterium]|nr:translesion error-prone DNA polymerase V autoproteolytic subunit [Victivallales bacterium]MBR6058746.1 translesion error-prone DNA polymerase V autoproteolytic subunit [Victivallales bacterium]MCR4574503.1 translesion error-prone DNA polymerase V autoproteolytic subunit [Lentisphaeria bacterium]